MDMETTITHEFTQEEINITIESLAATLRLYKEVGLFPEEEKLLNTLLYKLTH